jgi:hypothetical protein
MELQTGQARHRPKNLVVRWNFLGDPSFHRLARIWAPVFEEHGHALTRISGRRLWRVIPVAIWSPTARTASTVGFSLLGRLGLCFELGFGRRLRLRLQLGLAVRRRYAGRS